MLVSPAETTLQGQAVLGTTPVTTWLAAALQQRPGTVFSMWGARASAPTPTDPGLGVSSSRYWAGVSNWSDQSFNANHFIPFILQTVHLSYLHVGCPWLGDLTLDSLFVTKVLRSECGHLRGTIYGTFGYQGLWLWQRLKEPPFTYDMKPVGYKIL